MHNSQPQHWHDFDMMRAPSFVRLALEWRAPREWLYRDPSRKAWF